MYSRNEDARRNFYETFGKSDKSANEDVRNIKEWLREQTHLPEIMEDAKIRNFLQLNKFDIERTKEKIDAYYTIRSKIPAFFSESNPKLPNIQQVLNTAYCSTHPKPLDTSRVIFLKHKEPNSFRPNDLVKLSLAIFEIRLFEDCMIDDIIVFDLANLTLKDMTKISPKFIIRAFSVYKNVFALRLKTLYFLNSPLYVSVWMTLLKFLLKPKLFERVQIHRDAEVVKEILSMEDCPKDYGGDGPTLQELNDMVEVKLRQYQERFDEMDKLRVDEDLRAK